MIPFMNCEKAIGNMRAIMKRPLPDSLNASSFPIGKQGVSDFSEALFYIHFYRRRGQEDRTL